MALNSTWSLALGVAFFGTLSFIFGVIAENKKPPFGTAIKGKDVVICMGHSKTGLFGGAAFIALDATLFWLVCQMLTLNARADYLDEDQDAKGHYGQVYGTDYDAISAPNKA
ncbi:hypothetical protein LUZ63_015511 [Rhynchospora breviuscula]|uniref:Uncharacterized protein n=1 Tax=Rhynchospora breviuscula TaxID=2022672 RepID=A0A9Q0CCH0_9POAL|nr:hypothetical protein LUZ63_015511 [Rhynchospora breviuscula]